MGEGSYQRACRPAWHYRHAGCEEIGEKINQWLLKWHSLQELQDEEYYTSPGLNRDTFLVKAYCPRFGTGEGKAVLRESVRGMDLYILVDVCAA